MIVSLNQGGLKLGSRADGGSGEGVWLGDSRDRRVRSDPEVKAVEYDPAFTAESVE